MFDGGARLMACRFCTTNDKEALVEELAQEMWASCIDTSEGAEWVPWEQAGSYWHLMFQKYAAAFLRVAHRSHGHDG